MRANASAVRVKSLNVMPLGPEGRGRGVHVSPHLLVCQMNHLLCPLEQRPKHFPIFYPWRWQTELTGDTKQWHGAVIPGSRRDRLRVLPWFIPSLSLTDIINHLFIQIDMLSASRRDDWQSQKKRGTEVADGKVWDAWRMKIYSKKNHWIRGKKRVTRRGKDSCKGRVKVQNVRVGEQWRASSSKGPD